MVKLIVGVFAVMGFVAFGQALQCYKCDIGFWNVCSTSVITCGSGEQCFSGTGKAASVIDVKMKGCLKSEDCNTVATVEFLPNRTAYTMSKMCCSKNLCNVAPTLPVMTPLSLVLISLAAVLLLRVLS